jgi:hypothetical protein
MTDDDRPRPSLRVVGGTQADVPAADTDDAPAEAARGASYVCTWCALRFAGRADLDRHRADSLACRANQKVSSPLQTRYGDADMVWTQPGEMTLNRVRASTCRHAHPRARLVNAAGQTIGYQCGWCYGVLRDDLP